MTFAYVITWWFGKLLGFERFEHFLFDIVAHSTAGRIALFSHPSLYLCGLCISLRGLFFAGEVIGDAVNGDRGGRGGGWRWIEEERVLMAGRGGMAMERGLTRRMARAIEVVVEVGIEEKA